MKQKSLRFLIRIIGTACISFAVSLSAIAYPSGAPAGYTGSPGDGHHCVSCHNGSAVTVTGWITSNIPGAGYTPGTAYTVTVTVSGSGAKGFELSPQNATGTQLGVLAAGSNNHLVGGTKYVTQNSAGSSSSTVTYNCTWTAPVDGTGPVTFYAACCVGKSNTKLTTLVINENSVVPLAVVASAIPSTITPGGSSQLNATASGGTGTYTYSWTSTPAGFTSTLQNPLVSPTVTTQYTVTVSDGSGTAQGNVTVTVSAAPLTATATATPGLICAGQNSQLNVAAAGGNGTYTYFWTSVPAGFTSSLQNPVVTPVISTQYIAHVSDGSLTTDAPVSVTVNQPATAAAGNDTTCAFITAQVPLNGMATGYSAVLWATSGTGTFSDAGALAGAYYPSAADKTGGIVTLTLTASAQSPCTASASDARIIHFDGPTAIEEALATGLTVNVSPNPSHGIFTLRAGVPDHGKIKVTVTDISGRAIIQREMDVHENSAGQYDMTGHPGGLYFVNVRTANQCVTRKLVIE